MISVLTTFRILFCCVALMCSGAIALAQPPRMTTQQVVAAAKPAIEARFPGATKNHNLVAHVTTDGYWTVFFVHPGQPDRPKRGEPVAHVRDSDGKVVDVSLAP
jgi:hypothetical protein